MKIMSIATAAITQQTDRLAASAARVARAGDTSPEALKEGNTVDLAKEAVERIEASALTTANLKVIKAEDERLGTLINTFV